MKIKIFLATAVMMTCLMFVSCTQDDYDYGTYDNSNNEIAFSKEYAEHLFAFFEMQKVIGFCKSLDSLNYKNNKFYIEQKKLLDRSYECLIQKFPYFESINESDKIKLAQKAISVGKYFKRMKTKTTEALMYCYSAPGWVVDLIAIGDEQSAIDYCIEKGNNIKEYGGYGFTDGSLVAFTTTINNDNQMRFWFQTGMPINLTFHYHPSGNRTMSDSDYVAQSSLATFTGCSDFRILINSDHS